MLATSAAQPDVTLVLDDEGVIREASLSDAFAGEAVDGWIGHRWADTVADVGSDKVARLVEAALGASSRRRVSGFRQINQRFPSGREILMEYATVRLGGRTGGLIAIGRSLQAVTDLQERLVAAQQALERDYWKLREVETRYRLLFTASSEPALLVTTQGLRIYEANPAALRALGRTSGNSSGRGESLAGRALLGEVAPAERDRLESALERAQSSGKAPAVLVRFGPDREQWLVRASLIRSESGPLLLLQLGATGTAATKAPAATDVEIPIDALVARAPDGFVAIDRDGVVRRANRAFLDLVHVPEERGVLGERLGRWLGRPGADLTVLLANVRRYGSARLFATTLQSELGAETEVEISAAGESNDAPDWFGVVIRDVGRRLDTGRDERRLNGLLGALAGRIGKTTLRSLVRETVDAVERHYVEAALEMTGGNRTAAAELLGLSRQSLYVKLSRYGLAAEPGASPDGAD